jgi:transcription elongation factor GreA-like protein
LSLIDISLRLTAELHNTLFWKLSDEDATTVKECLDHVYKSQPLYTNAAVYFMRKYGLARYR